MKTWDRAQVAHGARIDWCTAFARVLELLRKFEAPAPDDVGAAHADWATPCGVIRIGRSMGGSIVLIAPSVLGHKGAADFPTSAPLENLEERDTACRAWATFLCKARGGTYPANRAPTELPPSDHLGEDVAARLTEARGRDYDKR